jgi:hypothetical protein
MKLLKTSLLLAAATVTQLDAATYNVNWSNGAGTTAVGTLDINTSLLNNGGNNARNGAWLTGMSITISGASNGNGTFTLSGTNNVQLNFTAPVDLNSQLVGQAGLTGGGGMMFGGVVDVQLGGFQWHTHGNNTLANDWDPDLQLTSFILAGPSGVVDFADWMSSVNNQNRVYAAGTTLANLPLEGAHHRPMMSFDRMGKDTQYWATGDFGSSSRVRDVKVTSGEVGVNKDIGPNTLAGFAIGRGQQNQDLALDGSNNVVGNYFLGEIDYRPFGSQWIVSLLGMVGSWDAKINRGYDNGGSTDYSLGQTDIITRSARLRVDAPVLFSVAGFGFSPYASYAVTQTTVDAYTENGGGLPASYDEQQHNATEARLGMMATNVINAKTKLIISLEGIHRFDGAGPALTGQDITGSVGFSLPGQAPRPDCVRLGVDVDYKLAADTLLNVSAHASTVGEVADVSGAISIRRAF